MRRRLFNLQIELEVPVYAEDAESAESMARRIIREMDHLIDAHAYEMGAEDVQSVVDGTHEISGCHLYHDGSRYTEVAAEDAARAHLAALEAAP